MSNMKISKQTINEYKDNTDILRGLSMSLKSSCNPYDMALYESLKKARKEEKSKILKLTISM